MKKREFLTSTAVLAALPVASVQAAQQPVSGPVLLTVSGAIAKGNRGPLDPALDQMMAKHGVRFDKALALDTAALGRMPAVQIKPTLEYDGKVHTLSGPLVSTVLEAAGVPSTGAVVLGLRAVDGYNVAISLADIQRYRMIIATPYGRGALVTRRFRPTVGGLRCRPVGVLQKPALKATLWSMPLGRLPHRCQTRWVNSVICYKYNSGMRIFDGG